MKSATIKRDYNYETKGITFDLIFSNRIDGERVLANMRMLILRCGYAKVLDLYDLAGVIPSSADPYIDYIWTDLHSANICATYDGYTIHFPKPMQKCSQTTKTYSDCYGENYRTKFVTKTEEQSTMATAMPKIRNVIFNDPATVVFWEDNTKTVVKCSKDDIYSPDTGLAMAICKKLYGGNFKQEFHKWTKKYEPESEGTKA